MLGKIEGKSRRGWQRMRWLGGITNSMDMSLSTGKPDMLQSMGSQGVGHDREAKQQPIPGDRDLASDRLVSELATEGEPQSSA